MAKVKTGEDIITEKKEVSLEKATSVKTIEEIRAEKMAKPKFTEENHEKVPQVKTMEDVRAEKITKVKTIEEIRAEKMAKLHPPIAQDTSTNKDAVSSSTTSSNKRTAPLGRQLRIKRAKLEPTEESSKTLVTATGGEVTSTEPSRTKSASECSGDVEMSESAAASAGRPIRIKRLRTNSAPAVPPAPALQPEVSSVQTKPAEPVAVVTPPSTVVVAPSSKNAVSAAPSAHETVDDTLSEDFLEEEDDAGMEDGDGTNGGSLNDDELLLEIDNILGD
jgi:hypothetical protein